MISESLRYCPSCSVSYNAAYRPLDYDDRYFLDEYQKQYGKTYEQDFPSIYNLSQQRLIKLLKHFPGKEYQGLRLLDIGSAMGFFLKAASDMGIGEVMGVEISRYASEYCSRTFGFSVINEAYSPDTIQGQFDIITAWYFIEHCPDPVRVIKELYGKLKPAGMLAFAVPSIFGPQYIFHKRAWAAEHPADHRIDFSPVSLKKVLKNAGFKKVFFSPGGFHPERIVPRESVFFGVFTCFYRYFSQRLSFSDTIEVYAVKE